MVRQEQMLVAAGLMALVWFMASLAPLGNSPRELYEAAKRLEQQANMSRASELYQKIVAEHPASHFARYSNDRLRHLNM